jgi:hypothetical protein
MSLEEFEIDGKKILINNYYSEDETGIAFKDGNQELSKTQEIKIITDEELNDKTTLDVFGEDHE